MRCASPADWLRWQTVMAFKQTQSSRKSQNYQNTRVKRSHQIMKNLLFTVFVLLLLQLLVPAAASLTKVQSRRDTRSRQSGEEGFAKHLNDKLRKLGIIARPVLSDHEAVNVILRISLLRVESVGRNAAELDVWLTMFWYDPRIKSYGSVYRGFVAVPVDLLWMPDIRPYNVLGFKMDKDVPIRALVFEDGLIHYTQRARLRVNCGSHGNGSTSCTTKFGSWAYHGDQLNLTLAEKSEYQLEFEGNGWSVSGESAVIETQRFECCKQPIVFLKYNLMLTENVSNALRESSLTLILTIFLIETLPFAIMV